MKSFSKIWKNLFWLASLYIAIYLGFAFLGFLAQKFFDIPWFNSGSIMPIATFLFAFILFGAYESVRWGVVGFFIITGIVKVATDSPIIWLYPVSLIISLIFASAFS